MGFYYFPYSGLANALTSTILGIFVLSRNYKSPTNRSFFYFAFSVAFWSYCYFLWQISKSPINALFWCRTLMAGAIFIPSAFLHFCINLIGERKKYLKIVIFWYAISFLFLLSDFTPLFVRDVRPRMIFSNWPTAGVAFAPFLMMFIGLTLYAHVLLYRAYSGLSGHKRNQIKYVFLGTAIGFIGGSTNYPLWYDINILPVGNILVSLYVAAAAYAIIRHQLMDIEVIIKKTLVFAGLSASVVGIFVVAMFLTQDILGNIIGIPKVWAYVLSAMIIAALIDPIRSFLINVTDKYLFQKRYNPAELIRIFSKSVLTELDLSKIAKSTVEKLVEALKLTSCAILVPDREADRFVIRECYGLDNKKMSYKKDTHLLSYLSKVNSAISKDGEKPLPKQVINDMDLINANVCLGIMLHKELIGVLSLGRKKSDQEYTKADIDTLLLLSDALGVAITNAIAFEDVRRKEKLATIGTLAAGIKHDIGTPLNKASSAVQRFLIAREEGDHKKAPLEEVISEAYDLLSRCQMTFEKVSAISAKFADFARPKRKAELESLNITTSIDDTLGVLEHELQAKNISIKKNIQKDLPFVMADKDYMQQIFFNIIRNAAQAIQEAGRDKAESIITINARELPEHNVSVEIVDTGVGIPEDSISKIFEAYYTTKPEGRGTGLGLAIVKELLERNNGKIAVKSKVGEGTTFILEFAGIKHG